MVRRCRRRDRSVKLSLNPHVALRLAMVAINSSPGRSIGLFSSGQSTCWRSGLEASWFSIDVGWKEDWQLLVQELPFLVGRVAGGIGIEQCPDVRLKLTNLDFNRDQVG